MPRTKVTRPPPETTEAPDAPAEGEWTPPPDAKPSAGATGPMAAASVLDQIEGIGREAAGRPKPALPFVVPKMSRGIAAVVESVIPERVNVQAEYDELAPLLRIEGALVPQVVKDHLNEVEVRALRAHRLFVIAKMDLERFERDCDEAIGAMRHEATIDLQKEKDKGERSKQITDADVRGRAATLFPDEWSEINGELARAKASVKNLERFSELWAGRRFSLGAIGDRR
jgi:hypothetical protein